MITYTLLRSKRKTLVIHITKDAAVEVRAPLKMPKTEIDKFIIRKEKWIRARLAKRKEQSSEKAAFTLDYGDSALLLGKLYPIAARDGKQAGYDGETFYLPPGLPPARIKQIMVKTYKSLAKIIMTEKAAKYTELMKVQPAKIGITSAKTRWGSCSGRNNINFSWRLIMAEEEVVDYVIVHELAHIKEHNHSPRFWAIVENILPDYAACKKKLKTLHDKLSREDWE
jgi:predicted metal-dependent hydrolase